MIKEIITKQYKTTDGEIFNEIQLATDHQKKLDLPDCEVCNGKGKVYEDAGYDCWGRKEFWSSKCKVCNGTGKQDENYEQRNADYKHYLKLKNEFDDLGNQ